MASLKKALNFCKEAVAGFLQKNSGWLADVKIHEVRNGRGKDMGELIFLGRTEFTPHDKNEIEIFIIKIRKVIADKFGAIRIKISQASKNDPKRQVWLAEQK